jgi:hypothetical protein
MNTMKTTINNAAKYLVALAAMILIPMCVFSQQVIKFKSGHEYEVKILYKTQDTVRYHLTSDSTVVLTALMDQVELIRDGKLTTITDSERIALLAKYKKNATIMGVGLGVLAGGVICLAAGLGTAVSNMFDNEASKTGGTLSLVGAGLILTGGVMAIVGGTNKAECRRKIDSFSLDLYSSPSVTGLTFRYKF